MTYAADDAVQSMCESAGMMGGLHPSRCDAETGEDMCRYHQGVEDAFDVMQQVLNQNGLNPNVESHPFVNGSEDDECAVCGDGSVAPQHVDADYQPLHAVESS